jgi:mannose-6-phosphate isomerase-like protein (cupin superfamily)
MNITENRPWGNYTVLLDASDCKVKTISIKPGESPSYQYHFKRREHWVIIQGSGMLILNDTERPVKTGDCIFVDKLEKHKIINTGTDDLKFIEIQTGEYFGEDDIVRLEDKYGRK